MGYAEAGGVACFYVQGLSVKMNGSADFAAFFCFLEGVVQGTDFFLI